MIKWIFFDVGNVILNDDPAMAFLYLKIYEAIKNEGNSVAFEELLALRERSILEKREGRHFVRAALNFLSRKKWSRYESQIKLQLREKWHELSPIIPGAKDVIQSLAKKYNLGIIANQPKNVLDVLKSHDVLRYFKLFGVSEIVGLAKPDPQFFRWAVEQANCKPEEAIMVGDRIDNDIVPAKTIGMRTIWLPLHPEKKGYFPQTSLEKIYFESIKRASVSQLPPRNEAEKPDQIALMIEEIPAKVKQIAE